MWFWFAIIFITYILGRIEWKRQRLSRQFRHIAGAKEYPFIGNVLSLPIYNSNNFIELMKAVCVAPVSKLIAGGYFILVIMDPVQIQRILTRKEFLERPKVFDFFQLKYGIFSTKYKFWRPIRKVTSATLNQAAVIEMVPIFNRHIDRLLDTLGGYLDKGTFNVEQSVVKFGIEQVFETMAGHQMVCSNELKEALQNAGIAVFERFVNVFYHPDFIYQFTNIKKIIDNASNVLNNFLNPIVNQRKTLLEEGMNNKTFIDELIKMETDKNVSKDELVEDNFKGIIIGGYETTATTMSFTILMLAMHPEVDEKLYNEITEYYNIGDDMSYETVKRMPYLDMVCKEVLRLFPIVPGTLREALTDTFIENIGTIPKGTIIGVPFFLLHRIPEVWGDDAEKFNPENFLPEKHAERHPYSYLPFSAGPRNCIGIHYANVNLRMGLVKILSKYRFTTKLRMEDLRFKMGITLRLSGGHDVEIHLR